MSAGTLTRAEAIEVCRVAGERRSPCGAPTLAVDVEYVLAGERLHPESFIVAVLDEARHHPALADSRALRDRTTGEDR